MTKNIKKQPKSETASEQPEEEDAKFNLRPELLDELLLAAGPNGLTGSRGLFRGLTAALINRALDAEMAAHLGFDRGDAPPADELNRRNGHRTKMVRTHRGKFGIEIPRDRAGTFEPQLVPAHQRSFDGFDDQIISLYARGMTTREIQGHLHEIYGVDVSPDLVSRVTDAVIDELKEWQCRTVESVYAIVYVDALVVKIRDKGTVENKSCYVVMGVDVDGNKDVLGLWLQRSEGAKFWLSILTELRARGLKDIFILCADGLTGMAEAVEAAFPKTIFQTCVVHMVRSSTRYVPFTDRREVCADLKALYTAASIEDAEEALKAVEAKWGKKYPHVSRSWRARFEDWTPFLAFPLEVRRVVYTTNAIEALNRQLRKTLKVRGPLPTDDAALKLIYLAIRNARKKSGRKSREWGQAQAQLAILFEERWPA